MSAIEKVMNPAVVDTTDYINIQDLDPPLLTLCPVGQIDDMQLRSTGYKYENGYKGFLLGEMFELSTYVIFAEPTKSKRKVSWGAHRNMSFWQVLNRTLDNQTHFPKFKIEDSTSDYFLEDLTTKFYPQFGYCFELENYKIENKVYITVLPSQTENFNYSAYKFFLTDRKLRTHTALEIESHKGNLPNILDKINYNFEVEVKLISNYDPRFPKACRNYAENEYNQCVDKELENLVKPILRCNPPWLSDTQACNKHFIGNWSEAYELKFKRTIQSILSMSSYPAKEACNKPCTVTQSMIRFRNKDDTSNGRHITLDFDSKVVLSILNQSYLNINLIAFLYLDNIHTCLLFLGGSEL